MVQNRHHYPWRHAPSLASRSLTGAGLPGGAPINAGKASLTGPCCTGAGRAGAGKVSPVMAGASRAASSATGLVSDEAKHLNGKSRPQLIGLNHP